ncbi:MAG: hypothetical protein CMP45_01410 [Rickettsiales bacterium]|nr:hypothetical protein [Rickettsiales bacterium]
MAFYKSIAALFFCSHITTSLATDTTQPWKRHTIDKSSVGADGIRMLDVNGDELKDIATGWEEGGIVRAYLHPGQDKAKELWPKVTVGKVKSPEDAVFADLDNDGAIDVISSCEGNNRKTFIHWAPKTKNQYLSESSWSTSVIPITKNKQSWMYALPMQIDQKHGTDLVISSKGKEASVSWLQAPQNPRNFSEWRLHKLQDAGWIMSLIDIDMDNDGDKDILVSDRRGPKRGVYWLERPEYNKVIDSGEWKRHQIGGSDKEILFISTGDLDKDRKTDVIAIDKKSIIWFKKELDSWKEIIIPLPEGVGTGKSTAVCDVNGDQKNDIVFSCENSKGKLSGMRWLSWNESPYSGSWTHNEIGGSLGHKYDRVVMYDVDGDGDLDALCCEEVDQLGVFWYENPHLN